MDLTEKTLSRETIYQGKIVTLYLDKAKMPNGAEAMREVIAHPGGVCIAPLTDDGKLIFVRQFRYPYQEVVLELPAGKLNKGEDPLEAGKRELKEETGAAAHGYKNMGRLYPSPGYCGEIIYLYLAYVDSIGDTDPDDDEFLEIEAIEVEKAVEMVMNGEISDAKTQTLVLKTARLLGK